MVGKATAQVSRTLGGKFKGRDSEVWESWTQAMNSGIAMLQQTESMALLMGGMRTFLLPILVVPDGCLWVVNYGSEGTVLGSPSAAEDCKVFIGQAFGGGVEPQWRYEISHAHFYTKSGLELLLGQLSSNKKFWEQFIPEREPFPTGTRGIKVRD